MKHKKIKTVSLQQIQDAEIAVAEGRVEEIKLRLRCQHVNCELRNAADVHHSAKCLDCGTVISLGYTEYKYLTS